jgi:hypothetical protein
MIESRYYGCFAAACIFVLHSTPAAATSSAETPTASTPSTATAVPSRGGFGIGINGGTNVLTPYFGARAGVRFSRADFFEVYVDYSYGAAISTFPFHTIGFGTRTYFFTRGRIELYHQGLLAVGLSSGGTAEVPNRTLGERLLGVFMTQGIGVDLSIWRGLHTSLTVSTGYPVWLRPELALGYRF